MEAPQVEANIWNKYRDHGVVVLALDIYNGNPNQVNTFLNSSGSSYTALMYASSVAAVYGAGTSDFFIIGPDGVVEYLARWYDEAALQANLDTLTDVLIDRSQGLPNVFALEQNFPNPFNPSTTIRYELRTEEKLAVRLTIFNLLGSPIRTLVNEVQGSGFYNATWNGTDNNNIRVPAGVYFYTLQAGDFKSTRRMILLP